MKQAFLKALTENIGLKILAIVLSFFLWLVVVNIDDPTQTRTFTAVVTVTNDDILNKAGKLYEIRDGINTVSFRVTAKRSIIEKLSSSDFSAVADMRYLESEERVPVTITAKSYANSITISSKQNYLYVVLEDEITSRFIIETDTVGEATNGLVINAISCSPNVITVTGREDVVTSIAKVVATCNIAGVTADITESVIPVFYDGSGEIVDSTGLQLSSSTVDVTVDFVTVKSVDVTVKTSGTLPEGLVLGSITTDPTSVMIKGQPANLNEVTAIVIPESVVNLTDLSGSISKQVDITAYLPDGVSLVDTLASKVTIYVNMEGEVSKHVNVPLKNVRFKDIPDDMTVSLSETSIAVNVFGIQSNIDALQEGQITGFIDCANIINAGEQSAILQFDDIEGITVQNITVSIYVVDSKKHVNNDNEVDVGQTGDTQTENDAEKTEIRDN